VSEAVEHPGAAPTASASGADAPAASDALGRTEGRALVLAWTLSISVHVMLFLLMFSLPWFASRADREDDLMVAQTELLDGLSKTRTTLEKKEPSFTPASTEPDPLRYTPRRADASSAIADASMPSGSGVGPRDPLSIIGLGGSGGDLGKYGLDVGSMDPGPQFFGLGGKARGAKRIIYVVDRSGSMTETFDAVRKELNHSVDRLRRSQRFHVVFFNEGAPLENPPKKLVSASGDQKTSLAEFLQRVMPEGNTDPIPAMRRAFELGPDLIYFLTDGEFDPRLVEELRRRNAQKKIRNFTIAYVSQMGSALLEQIARENNGEFRFVSEYDL
jgi:hypothetical protein